MSIVDKIRLDGVEALLCGATFVGSLLALDALGWLDRYPGIEEIALLLGVLAVLALRRIRPSRARPRTPGSVRSLLSLVLMAVGGFTVVMGVFLLLVLGSIYRQAPDVGVFVLLLPLLPLAVGGALWRWGSARSEALSREQRDSGTLIHLRGGPDAKRVQEADPPSAGST